MRRISHRITKTISGHAASKAATVVSYTVELIELIASLSAAVTDDVVSLSCDFTCAVKRNVELRGHWSAAVLGATTSCRCCVAFLARAATETNQVHCGLF